MNAGAEIRENCIINTGAVVEHDCLIGKHVHLSSGVTLAEVSAWETIPIKG